MTEKEEWRKVRGYDGYLVSDKGRVFSMKVKRLMKPHKRDSPGGKTGRPQLTAVCLTRNGKKHTLYVHRLVADTFICELTHADAVMHHNGDDTDNRLENLYIKGNSNMERTTFNAIQSPDQADLHSMSWSVQDESGSSVAKVVLIKSGGYSVSCDGDLSEKAMQNLQSAIASALAWGVL